MLNLISCLRLRKKFINSCDVSCSSFVGIIEDFSCGFMDVGKLRGGGVHPSSEANFCRVPNETPDDLNEAHFFSHSAPSSFGLWQEELQLFL